MGDRKKGCKRRVGRKGGSSSGSLQPNYCSTEGKGQLAKEMIAPTFVICVIWLLLTLSIPFTKWYSLALKAIFSPYT